MKTETFGALGSSRMSNEAQQKERNFVTPAPPDSPVEQTLANLQTSMESLHQSVCALISRLSPILATDDGVGAAIQSAPCPGRSPIACNLSDLLQAQYGLHERIQQLIQRIEV